MGISREGDAALSPEYDEACPYSITARSVYDVDDQASCLKSWRQHYDQLSAGRFIGQFGARAFNQIYLFREQANQVIHQQGALQAGLVSFGVPLGVDGAGWYCGQICDQDSVFMLRGGDVFEFRTPQHHELMAVTVDIERFCRFVAQTEQREIRITSGCTFGQALICNNTASFRAFLLAMFDSCVAVPGLLQHAGMRKGMEQAVYWALLEILDFSVQQRSVLRIQSRQRVVNRARAYMQAHIDEPITIADLCEAVGASRRTIQYSFQEVLNLNPVSFLRALRLNGVRRALKNAAPQTSVADIAARWGFWHLSHFAADYREMFGERPSETLRQQVGHLIE